MPRHGRGIVFVNPGFTRNVIEMIEDGSDSVRNKFLSFAFRLLPLPFTGKIRNHDSLGHKSKQLQAELESIPEESRCHQLRNPR